jgi:SH3-like domain-containing protein
VNRRKAKARIRLEYQVEYQNPIQVKAGERVHVGQADDDYPGWLWSRATDGREGWVPVELLSGERPLATALVDYSAKELAVQIGDEVEIEEVRHGWALVRNTQGEVGWIPESQIDT